MQQWRLKVDQITLAITIQLISLSASAQDGGAALDQANTTLRTYYDTALSMQQPPLSD